MIAVALFAAVWAAELFLVQKLTLISPQSAGPRFEMFAPIIRLLLDVCFVSVLSLTLRRSILAGVSVAVMLIHVFLLTYYHYFQRPLSLLTLLNNWNEGIAVVQLGPQLIPLGIFAWLFLALLVKLILLSFARSPKPPRWMRVPTVVGLVVVFASLSVLALRLDPLSKILTTRGIGRLGLIRGYLGPWCAEFIYLNNDQILKRALADREHKSDLLHAVETPVPIAGPLVIIQAESLDYSILGHRIDGREVTPFLNSLRQESMTYRLLALHPNGSADADFAATTSVGPSADVINYNIPNYPYEDTLPQFLFQHGYKSIAYHGNSGNFYNRRTAFEKMGFTGVVFEEELVREFAFELDEMGVRDADMFGVSAQRLQKAGPRTCHFIITLTSHTPFNLVPPGERQFFPAESGMAEGYFNSMRYLDDALRNYVNALPDGTTVVIYGDHAAGIETDDYQSDRQGAHDFVPGFIYRKGVNLAAGQKTRDQPLALDGQLTVVDLMNYVRHQVRPEKERPTSKEQNDDALLMPLGPPAVAPALVNRVDSSSLGRFAPAQSAR